MTRTHTTVFRFIRLDIRNGASLIKEPYNDGYKNIFFKANNDEEIEIAIVQVDPDEQF